MTSNNTNQNGEYKKWAQWFSGVEEPLKKKYFDRWRHLNETCERLSEILSHREISMASALDHLKQAGKRLKYDVPYHVVVLGESGAGKSTLLNAVIGQSMLITGSGAAVTGVPVRIHTSTVDNEDKVLVTMRTDAEFATLLADISKEFEVSPPAQLAKAKEWLTGIKNNTSKPNPGLPARFFTDCEDIVRTWEILTRDNKLGQVKHYDPVAQREDLKKLMDETIGISQGFLSDFMSGRSRSANEPRIIAGVAKVEYFLIEKKNANTLLPNTVLVDTPGSGAPTLRHHAILRTEIKAADAVVLVVKADRPKDQSGSIAELLESVLFPQFTDEEKNHFASKVFLVVNRIEEIKSQEDRARLDSSIKRIGQTISPNYLQRYGQDSRERRYFEVTALLGVYAQAMIQRKDLAPEHKNYYDGLLRTKGLALDTDSNQALESSGINQFKNSLREFLGIHRMRLTLDDAELQIERAVKEAQREVRAVLDEHNVPVDDMHNLAQYNQQFCEQQLELDKIMLFEMHEALTNELYKWRASGPHRQRLVDEVNQIYVELEQTLRSHLSTLLRDKSLVEDVLDDVTGKYYNEGRVRAMLLELERHLRAKVEEKSMELAGYYLNRFDEIIKAHNLYPAIADKSYRQPYISLQGLNGKEPQSEQPLSTLTPILDLQQKQKSIREEYVSIARWILLYELIHWPILVPDQQFDFSPTIVGVIKTIAPEVIAQVIEIFLSPVGMAPALARFSGIVASGAYSASIGEAEPQPMEWSLAESKLATQIGNALLAQDYREVERIVLEQFASRYRSSFGIALPFIEALFFYELGKFRLAFQNVIDNLISKHIAYVSVELETNAGVTIRQELMKAQSQIRENIQEAAEILETVASVERENLKLSTR